jgi:hypothetical protein
MKAFPPNFHHHLSRQRGNSREGQPFFWLVKIRLGRGIWSPVVAHVHCVTQRHIRTYYNMLRRYVDPLSEYFICFPANIKICSSVDENFLANYFSPTISSPADGSRNLHPIQHVCGVTGNGRSSSTNSFREDKLNRFFFLNFSWSVG